MWSPLLRPGLTLLSGDRRELRAFHHELAHFVVHHRDGAVLWADGDHGFDPYHFAERNLVTGHQADHGAGRVLVKRCMTAFQWDSVLTQHLDQKLLQTDASLVLAAPYDRLFVHEELQDWEQEDYVRYSLRHLEGLAERFQVPVLLSVDMGRWWRSHPALAQATYEAVAARWAITRPDGRWRAEADREVVDPWLRRQVTLLDYVEEIEAPVVLPPVPRRRPKTRAVPV